MVLLNDDWTFKDQEIRTNFIIFLIFECGCAIINHHSSKMELELKHRHKITDAWFLHHLQLTTLLVVDWWGWEWSKMSSTISIFDDWMCLWLCNHQSSCNFHQSCSLNIQRCRCMLVDGDEEPALINHQSTTIKDVRWRCRWGTRSQISLMADQSSRDGGLGWYSALVKGEEK